MKTTKPLWKLASTGNRRCWMQVSSTPIHQLKYYILPCPLDIFASAERPFYVLNEWFLPKMQQVSVCLLTAIFRQVFTVLLTRKLTLYALFSVNLLSYSTRQIAKKSRVAQFILKPKACVFCDEDWFYIWLPILFKICSQWTHPLLSQIIGSKKLKNIYVTSKRRKGIFADLGY